MSYSNFSCIILSVCIFHTRAAFFLGMSFFFLNSVLPHYPLGSGRNCLRPPKTYWRTVFRNSNDTFYGTRGSPSKRNPLPKSYRKYFRAHPVISIEAPEEREAHRRTKCLIAEASRNKPISPSRVPASRTPIRALSNGLPCSPLQIFVNEGDNDGTSTVRRFGGFPRNPVGWTKNTRFTLHGNYS